MTTRPGVSRRAWLGAALAGGAAGAWAAPAALPGVLQRAATATPLAPQAALLAAARAGRRLVLAGERGIVLTSDDAGATWQQAEVPVQASLTALAFADERRGWAAGHFGVLLNTTDGGRRWQRVLDGVQAAQLALDAAPDDAQRRAAERKLAQGPDKPWFDLATAPGRLYAVGAFGLALEVPEGGAPRSFAHRLPNPRQLHLYGVRAAGERVYVVGEQGLLLRSTDGGARFEALPSPYKGSFFGVLVTLAGSVLAYGLRGNLWRSTDGGERWAPVPNPVPVGLGAAVQRADGLLLLAAQNGDLLTSRDDGQTFQRHPAAPPFPAAALVAAEGERVVLAGLRGLTQRTLA